MKYLKHPKLFTILAVTLLHDNTMNRSTLISRFVYQFVLVTILLPASIVLANEDAYYKVEEP
jgi:hypothetical protein